MELYQIKYFLALCETVNFARAAEKCGVSQPSLTRAVQKLEREFGGILIRRERRHTHLTELGHLVRPMLEEVLAYAARAKTAAEHHLSNERAVLRLGVMSSIGLVRLAPFLARFGAESPEVELRLVESPSSTIYDALFNSSLDAAVVTYCSRLDKRLRYYRLYSERLVAVMPRGHPFEQFEATRLRDLRDQNFLLCTNCELGQLLMDTCREQGFEPNIVYQSAREDWVQSMVASGFGVTIMPEFTRNDATTVARPLVEPAMVREVSLVTVAGRRHAPALASLARTARANRWCDEHAAIDAPVLLLTDAHQKSAARKGRPRTWLPHEHASSSLLFREG